uniref:Uncharacterized protein AlNc14C67G4722 n=1 Tax=Albugo laibachii Nc14 TaxID=890382 RepID=F0WDK2_9STRA|nr:conserved hypothetical protein [Albugo laibachii Nc14]|eukprot:CCA19276.1 conserved hypothetical protein [Albugo laibachii Nc14]
MLRSTTTFVASLRENEQKEYVQKQEILQQVHEVLNEMVYDVEICEHERGKHRLQSELQTVRTQLDCVQERETELRNRYSQLGSDIDKISEEGNTLVTNVHRKLQQIVLQLEEKDQLEILYHQAKEQIKSDAELSKDLAKAQSVIRDLRRKQKVQQMIFQGPVPKLNSIQLRREADHDDVRSMLKKISDRQLLDIFAYLEAPDVLAIGMVNRGLRDRIHTIFGMKHTFDSNTSESSVSLRNVHPTLRPNITTLEKTKERLYIMTNSKLDMIIRSLKKDEMKLFRDMSHRIKSLESNLTQTNTEREDLSARLASAEDVRDFLMVKLKEAEEVLATTFQKNKKQDEQLAMDREIIGFLDAKAQQYELTINNCARENEQYRNELKRIREENEARIKVTQDMVEVLAEEKSEIEAQLRSQRKLLVREVKVLRAQLRHLQKEKEQHHSQWKQLKDVLVRLDDAETW